MEYDNNHFIIDSRAYSLQNVRGYGWLLPNCGDMRDGGSLGEQLLPPSVPLLVTAAGAESLKKPSPSLSPWLAA
jgi:hypothetical protein